MLQYIFNNILHISNKYLIFYIYTIIYFVLINKLLYIINYLLELIYVKEFKKKFYIYIYIY